MFAAAAVLRVQEAAGPRRVQVEGEKALAGPRWWTRSARCSRRWRGTRRSCRSGRRRDGGRVRGRGATSRSGLPRRVGYGRRTDPERDPERRVQRAERIAQVPAPVVTGAAKPERLEESQRQLNVPEQLPGQLDYKDTDRALGLWSTLVKAYQAKGLLRELLCGRTAWTRTARPHRDGRDQPSDSASARHHSVGEVRPDARSPVWRGHHRYRQCRALQMRSRLSFASAQAWLGVPAEGSGPLHSERGQDLNLRPLRYGPNELPTAPTRVSTATVPCGGCGVRPTHYKTESVHVASCLVMRARDVSPDQTMRDGFPLAAPCCPVQRRLSTGCPPEGGIVQDVVTGCWRAAALDARQVTCSHRLVETEQPLTSK